MLCGERNGSLGVPDLPWVLQRGSVRAGGRPRMSSLQVSPHISEVLPPGSLDTEPYNHLGGKGPRDVSEPGRCPASFGCLWVCHILLQILFKSSFPKPSQLLQHDPFLPLKQLNPACCQHTWCGVNQSMIQSPKIPPALSCSCFFSHLSLQLVGQRRS